MDHRRVIRFPLLEPGEDYRIEDAGSAEDGTTLYAVYKSIPIASEDTEAM